MSFFNRIPRRPVKPAAVRITLIILLGFGTLTGCEEKMETAEIELGGEIFTIELARTPEQRQLGLMNRKELAADRGMLFIFEYDQKLSFWMKNTYIPLDIAYIAKDGEIKEVHPLKPLSENPVYSSHSVRYALEVNRGTFENLGIGPGDIIDLPR